MPRIQRKKFWTQKSKLVPVQDAVSLLSLELELDPVLQQEIARPRLDRHHAVLVVFVGHFHNGIGHFVTDALGNFFQDGFLVFRELTPPNVSLGKEGLNCYVIRIVIVNLASEEKTQKRICD